MGRPLDLRSVESEFRPCGGLDAPVSRYARWREIRSGGTRCARLGCFLSVRGPRGKRAIRVDVVLWVADATRGCWLSVGGGALSPLGRPEGPSAKRLTGAVPALAGTGVCARAPSLISVRGPGWLRVGDMMVDGVIPQEDAVRPLGLSGPSTRAWRRKQVGSRPRCIGVMKGCARIITVQAGASASSPSSDRVW